MRTRLHPAIPCYQGILQGILRFWSLETRFGTKKPLRCSHFPSNSLILIKLTGKIFWGSGNLFQVTGNFNVILSKNPKIRDYDCNCGATEAGSHRNNAPANTADVGG